MLVIEIDVLRSRRLSESSTTFLMCAGRLLRMPPASMSKPNLLATTTLSRIGAERFPHELFIRERAVHFGRVEERDAPLIGGTDDPDALVSVRGWSVVGADAHAPKTDFRHLERSKFSRLHFFPRYRALDRFGWCFTVADPPMPGTAAAAQCLEC